MVTIALNALASSGHKPFGDLTIGAINATQAQGADVDRFTTQGLKLLLSASERSIR